MKIPTSLLFKAKKSTAGFTLIEILVASVILFSSIAVVSVVYKGAYLASEKADSHMTIAGAVPIILGNIREKIRGQGNADDIQLHGNDVAWGVVYQWRADQLDFKPPPVSFDIDSGQMIESDNKYKLWQVEVTLTYSNASHTFEFNELSWNEK
ncbi:type IV pilus modification PilV family protein [Thalassomonas actiniarum]|uniref:Prepilin-type N-terminal cleavage/methylation domain-containing protein n=1 Tax=Thalassomonas actiniarum TaxID=485447 RepID=A0AAE9YSN8_9GAMM|nr:prepilin-type N-terminal cleavage/methylation domain-containing protein [Thalassomonas actiniarum]WDE00520.1 prepilin-type N-terminal cleavage/methylation domain-containing protein [Thalassomonas actiniarum]